MIDETQPKPVKPKNPKRTLSVWDAAEQAERDFGIPTGLLRGLGMEESYGLNHWDENGNIITSPTGPRGAFQFTKKTASQYRVNRDNPLDNIVGAAALMRDNYRALRSQIDDDTEAWIAAAIAHNRGLGAVQGMIRDRRFYPGGKDSGNGGDTKTYTVNILNNWAKLRGGSGGGGNNSVNIQPMSYLGDAPGAVQVDLKTGGAVKDNFGTPEEAQKFNELYPGANVPVPEIPPVPETPQTIQSQTIATTDPNLPAAIATLLTEKSQVPAVVPKGFFTLESPEGTLLVNEQKLKDYYRAGKRGIFSPAKARKDLLEGRLKMTDLIGGKAAEFADTSGGTTLVSRNSDGTELNASKISESEFLSPLDLAAAERQSSLDKQRFGGQTVATQELAPTQKVAEERIAALADRDKLPDELPFPSGAKLKKNAETGKYANEDGDEFQVDVTPDGKISATPASPFAKKLKLTDGSVLTRNDDVEATPKGRIYTDERGTFFTFDGENIVDRRSKEERPSATPEDYQAWLEFTGRTDSQESREKFANDLTLADRKNFGKSEIKSVTTDASTPPETPKLGDAVYGKDGELPQVVPQLAPDSVIEAKPGSFEQVKTVAEALDTSAGEFKVDLSKKPKGMSLRDYIFRASFGPLAARYGVDIDTAMQNVLAKRGGLFVNDDEKLAAMGDAETEEFIRRRGNIYSVSYRLGFVNEALGGSREQIAAPIADDFKQRQQGAEFNASASRDPLAIDPATPDAIDRQALRDQTQRRNLDEEASRREMLESKDASIKNKGGFFGDLSLTDYDTYRLAMRRILSGDPFRDVSKEELNDFVRETVNEQIQSAGSAARALEMQREYEEMSGFEARIRNVGDFSKTVLKFPALFARTIAWAEEVQGYVREKTGVATGVTPTDVLNAADWLWAKSFGLKAKKQEQGALPNMIADSIERAFPDDPKTANTFAGKLARGVGSAVPFLIGAVASGGSTAVVALLGIGSSTGELYQQAKDAGLSREKRLLAGLAGVPLGASEMLGLKWAKLGQLLNSRSRGLFLKSFTKFAYNTGKEFSEETLQEFFQSSGGKMVISALKKDGFTRQDVADAIGGSIEDGLSAGIVGALFGGGGQIVQGARYKLGNFEKLEETDSQILPVASAESASSENVLPEPEKNADSKESAAQTSSAGLTGQTVVSRDGRTGTVVKDDGGKSVVVEWEKGNQTQAFRRQLTVQEEKEESSNNSAQINESNKSEILEQAPENPAVTDESSNNLREMPESATAGAFEAATSPENDLPVPTDAQKEAGNFKMGHITVGGLNISVEYPKGSDRTGTDKKGNAWSRRMENHYGYIKRTKGADDENIDVFVKDGTPEDFSGQVFVVDQVRPDTGEFDEHKILIGYESESDARAAYLANYAKDWKGLQSITPMPFEQFKTWTREGDMKTPVAAGAVVIENDASVETVSADTATPSEAVGSRRVNRALVEPPKSAAAKDVQTTPANVQEKASESENTPKITVPETEPNVQTTKPDVQEKSNRSVEYDGKSYELTDEQAARWEKEVAQPTAEAAAEYQKSQASPNAMRREMGAKQHKAAGFQIAAVKRDILGAYTGAELAEREKREASNYIGKEVSVDGKNGKVAANVFKKVKVEFADGSTAMVEPDSVKPPIAEKPAPKNTKIKAEKLAQPLYIRTEQKQVNMARKVSNKAALKKLGYEFKIVSKKTLKLVSKPESVDEGSAEIEFLNKLIESEGGRIARLPDRKLSPSASRHNLPVFVQRSGGIRPDGRDLKKGKVSGELRYLSVKEGGMPGMVSKNSGYNAEQMAQKAFDAGFFPEYGSYDEFNEAIPPEEFLRIVRDESRRISVLNKAYEDIEASVQKLEESRFAGEGERYIEFYDDERIQDIEFNEENADLITEVAKEYGLTDESINALLGVEAEFESQAGEIEGEPAEISGIPADIREIAAESVEEVIEEYEEFFDESEPDEVSDDDLSFDFDDDFDFFKAGSLKSAELPPGTRTNFAQAVKDYLAGRLPKGTPTQVLDFTPEYFRRFGAKNFPILLDYDAMEKILGNEYKHKNDILPDIFLQMPNEIADPVMIVKYVDRNTQRVGLNVLTTILTPDKRMVVAGLSFNQKAGRLVVNKLATVHAKNMQRTFDDWVKDKAVRYINKEKARSLATTYGSPLASVVQQSERDIPNLLTEADFVNKPLKKVRDAASENRLTTELLTAHTEDVLTGMTGGEITADGDFEISEYESEMLRRLLAEDHFAQNGSETEELPFGGIVFDAATLRRIGQIGQDHRAALKDAGYADEQLEGYGKLLENLDRLRTESTDFGVAFVFDDALAEEKFHQEDRRAKGIDRQAFELLQNSPFAKSLKFRAQYAGASAADRISEIAAKLATGQEAKYGWDKIENFDKLKTEFLNNFADGIIRNNRAEIEKSGISAFLQKFPRITEYAKIEENSERGSSENTGRSSASENDRGEVRGENQGEASEKTSAGRRPKADRRAAEKQKVKAEAEAAGVSETEIRTKNRRFAETLRENGRDAADVPYIPESEAEWIDEAKEILKQSRAIADETGAGDYDHAIEIFESPEIKGSTKTALGIALIDHLGAAGDYEAMRRVAEISVNHVGTAAQALRASQLVSKYDFAKGVQLAQRSLEARGKSLTDQQIEQLKELTEKYAQSESERSILEHAVKEAEQTIKTLEAEREEIEDALGESRAELGFKDKTINNLRQQLARWKEKVVGESAAQRRMPKSRKDLADRRALILDKLKTAFPENMGVLKSVAAENQESENRAIGDDVLQAMTEYAALKIFDGMPYKELIEHLGDVSGGKLTEEDVLQIHSDAELMTRGERIEQNPDVLKRIRIKSEHRSRAESFRRREMHSQNVPINRVQRALIENRFLAEKVRNLALIYADGAHRPSLPEMRTIARQMKLGSAAEQTIKDAVAEVDKTMREFERQSLENRELTAEEARALQQDRARVFASYRDILKDIRPQTAMKRTRMSNPNLNRLEREMLRAAGDNQTLGAAAVAMNRAKSKDDWFANIERILPDAKQKDLDALFAAAVELRGQARASLEKMRAEIKEQKALTDREFEELKNKSLVARQFAKKQRDTLDQYYKRLKFGLADKVLGLVQEATGIFKGLSATGEISMVLRQNLMLWFTHPVRTAKSLEGIYRGAKSGWDEAGMLRYIESLRGMEYFQQAQMSGLELSEIGDFNVADEHFVARVFDAFAEARHANPAIHWAELPLRIFGKTYKAIELANTLFGDQARLETFSYYARMVDGQNLSSIEKRQAKKYAADVINKFSGRGDIASVLASGGALSKLVNMSFFSFRLLLSRPQSLYHLTTGFATAPKGMRMQMAREGLKFYAWVAMLALLAGLELDPEDNDFGKIKFPSRDLNMDALAGMDAPLLWLFGIALGSFKQIGAMARGEDSDELYQSFERLFKKFWYIAEAAERDDNFLSGIRYWRGKASPAASLMLDRLTGKDFIGRPFNWSNALKSRLLPLSYQQAYEALYYDRYASIMKESSVAQGQLDIMNGLIIFFGTGIGFGLTQYPGSREKSEAETLAWELYTPSGKKKSDATPEEKRIQMGIRSLVRLREDLALEGKPTTDVDAAIAKFSKLYNVPASDLADYEKQAKEGRFAFVTKQMSLEDVEKIAAKATEQERPEINQILAKKRVNAIKKEEREKPKNLADQLNRADTDKAVELWEKYGNSLSEQQQTDFKNKLKQKAAKAQAQGTLTQEELDKIKLVVPDIKAQPSSRPKKPKKTTLPSLRNIY